MYLFTECMYDILLKLKSSNVTSWRKLINDVNICNGINVITKASVFRDKTRYHSSETNYCLLLNIINYNGPQICFSAEVEWGPIFRLRQTGRWRRWRQGMRPGIPATSDRTLEAVETRYEARYSGYVRPDAGGGGDKVWGPVFRLRQTGRWRRWRQGMRLSEHLENIYTETVETTTMFLYSL